jgi:hypothetical protein
MRANLMASRMRYLQTAVRQLRNFISTEELSKNRVLLMQLRLVEYHLKHMEQVYVYAKPD